MPATKRNDKNRYWQEHLHEALIGNDAMPNGFAGRIEPKWIYRSFASFLFPEQYGRRVRGLLLLKPALG